jgi:predicted membrane channel-forming protein YqfA (hemolysin III family)
MDRLPVNKPSWRKPAGVGLILLLIIVWSIIVVSAAELIADQPWPVHLIFYVVAGLVWIAPVKPLLRWMEGVGR